MIMNIYILPLAVSFREIAVEEVPCDIGVSTGYFSFPAMAGVSSHTTQNGAGTWCNVDEDNNMGVDRPGIHGSRLRAALHPHPGFHGESGDQEDSEGR